MIVSKTPYRVSFFGGGSDYPTWIEKNSGCVLGTTIDKYCYIFARLMPDFFLHKSRLVYSTIELFNYPEEVRHPAVREVLKYLNLREGIEIYHYGELPARSGIGSSSAFTTGLLNCLGSLVGNTYTKEELVKQSIHIEQDIIGEVVGSQDQTLVAHGGLNFVEFDKNGSIDVKKVNNTENVKTLESNLMLFFNKQTRNSQDYARRFIKSIDQKSADVFKLMELAKTAKELLDGNSFDVKNFGELLSESWGIKRSVASGITNDFIDESYDAAISAGAIGGKLLGAGGAGFMIFLVPPEKQNKVRDSLNKLTEVPFKFEQHGSRVLTDSF